MLKKNKAFTLAEILIMLVIMSIVTTIILQTTKPLTQGYKSLYYYALNNVKKIGGELVAMKSTGKLEIDDTKFCPGLIDILTTVGYDSVCGPLYTANKITPFGDLDETKLGVPTFVLGNGQRFYLSTRIPELPNMGYRVITVDLNGKSRPNILGQDIVSFIMYDNGEVVPVGNAAEDKSYLMVTTKIFSKYTGNHTGNYVKDAEGSKLLSYRNGVCTAGYSSAFSDYCSSSAGFLNSYTVNDSCTPENANTFCQVSYIKPMINIKM